MSFTPPFTPPPRTAAAAAAAVALSTAIVSTRLFPTDESSEPPEPFSAPLTPLPPRTAHSGVRCHPRGRVWKAAGKAAHMDMAFPRTHPCHTTTTLPPAHGALVDEVQ